MKFNSLVKRVITSFVCFLLTISRFMAAGEILRVNNTHPTYNCNSLNPFGAGRCNAA